MVVVVAGSSFFSLKVMEEEEEEEPSGIRGVERRLLIGKQVIIGGGRFRVANWRRPTMKCTSKSEPTTPFRY
jgi:hypothetical protein